MMVDGRFQEELLRPLLDLRDRLDVHLITVDAYGQQSALDARLGFPAVRIRPGNEAEQKQAYVAGLGAGVAAIGHGAADAAMIAAADLGICVLAPEGAAVEALLAADLVAPDMSRALALFLNPLRIVSMLRK